MGSKREVSKVRIVWRNEKGDLHRLDGPAVEWNSGTKEWRINGKLHREDGPAIEYFNGVKEWYLNGKYYKEEQYREELIKLKLNRIKDL